MWFKKSKKKKGYKPKKKPVKKVVRTHKKRKAPGEYYVDPEQMVREIKTFYKTGFLKDDLALMVEKIATRLSFSPNFINYSFRDEMIGDAKVKMFAALVHKKFNPRKGNPFSYFTKIAFHAYCNRIKKEKKEHDVVERYRDEYYDTAISDGKKKTVLDNEGTFHE